MVANGSILDMPQFRRKDVNGLCKTFNMYVNFPEERCDEIRRTEDDTLEAAKKYEELKKEFIETFWNNGKKDIIFEESAAEINPLGG